MTNDTREIHIRALAARDSLDAVTALLHLAYAPLAACGMDFAAATQSAQTTRRCVAAGQCFVAERAGAVVGTVTVSGPYEEAVQVPWLRDADTAHFHQFAVHPDHQGMGIGRRLVEACENWARERRYRRLALDIVEGAEELRALYARLGYREIGREQIAGRQTRSIIMRKSLDRSPLAEHMHMLARYHVWATHCLLDALAALPEADYRRDARLFFGSVHATLGHLLVVERELWWQRFVQGASPHVRLDADIEPARARLAEQLARTAAGWGPWLETVCDGQLEGLLAYRTLRGAEVALPFAAALTHVFNHATHHRGQITAALSAMGHASPELDLVCLLQQEAAAR